MPDFSRAEITTTSTDLTAYTTFLRKLQVGQAVTLPLEANETSRKIMRAINSAAEQLGVRLVRLPSDDSAVRFRMLAPEKRAIRMSDEAKRVRVEKAKATKAAKQAGIQDETTGMEADVARASSEAEPLHAELLTEDIITKEAMPPEQQVQEAKAELASPTPSRRTRRAARSS